MSRRRRERVFRKRRTAYRFRRVRDQVSQSNVSLGSRFSLISCRAMGRSRTTYLLRLDQHAAYQASGGGGVLALEWVFAGGLYSLLKLGVVDANSSFVSRVSCRRGCRWWLRTLRRCSYGGVSWWR